MRVTVGPLHYAWHEDWAKTPDTELARANGRTHGVAEARNGEVFVFYQASPSVLVYSPAGELVRSFAPEFPHAHGLTLVAEGEQEFLWLTDQASGRVAKLTLTGETVQVIERPEHPIYSEKRYMPTWVAVNPADGTIFVTDGYGSSHIHAYSAEGTYRFTIDGTEGAAGAFACPHGIFFDTRGGKDPELYIADRGNRRIQVYDGAGTYKRVFGSAFLNSPCCFAAHGEYLFVPELNGALAVLEGQDRLVGFLGRDEAIHTGDKPQGWPNVPRECLKPGLFNSPHGIGTGADGSIYLVEWYFPGGRITKLQAIY